MAPKAASPNIVFAGIINHIAASARVNGMRKKLILVVIDRFLLIAPPQ
jgi:hypothetical protein